MSNFTIRPEYYIPDRRVTPERAFRHRREFLRQLGFTGAGLLAASLAGCGRSGTAAADTARASGGLPAPGTVVPPKGYPAQRHADFNPGWPLTNEQVAAEYNNFYEFSTTKDRVHQLVDKFKITPWPIEISGLVEKPLKLDAQELLDMFPLEERVYRFRCVEAWAMIVPWTGFPLNKLLEKVQPKSAAKFVKFISIDPRPIPDQMPGADRLSDYPWPYTEGLRLDEAMHDLVLVASGIYGKPLPKQHGAPLRMVVPWKYGYKGAKSIVKIELVADQPETLWQTLAPSEYPFESNVDPEVPHPRWSQATERMIDTDDRVRTQPYNGYGKLVASLYQ